ncbi:hypothetical protein L202_08250 [Cryptococcus amylolentus CBS 6039]|uniref:DUF1996 domain-containing protein n=1 Tax=Cryptococcus amylolentus CBS 6039 TaxID=1295533 RepID=A0A1E3H905_9TREE|nr:hypothetical protein L202_08250 [Cryptococcus amylolentus CBS 6039]ODN72817.1 hypothetical protein L202_08250 [Cryptococcus amylolentus CBS 6039]
MSLHPQYSSDNHDPFLSRNPSATSSLPTVEDASNQPQYAPEQQHYAPPPLPPRPSAALTRKPVPAISDSDLPALRRRRSSATPPPVPPRPNNQYSTYIAAPAAAYTVQPQGPVDSRLPPPPPPPASSGAAYVATNEKAGYEPKRRSCWPATRRGKWILFGIIAALIVIIAVVAAVCAVVIPNHSSSSSSSSAGSASDNGGHPLSIAEGGVDKGEAGDIPVHGNRSADHFVMTTNRSIVVTRLDPIVNPGAIGSHMHRVHGSSYFTQNLTSATEMQELANCTTTVVQDDLSAYWVSALYYRYSNGSLVSVPLDRTSLYYFQKAPTGETIYPFPDNYNIVAGDPYRRYVNESDPNHTAFWYQCYRGDGNDLKSWGFPKSACSGGLVQGIQFPSCWDGVYADDGDYTDHVTYPTDDTNGYYCPSDFPKKFITLQFETVFAVYDFPYNGNNNITWLLANGDTTGYGIHADFMNGWKTSVLQGVLDDCRYMNATDIDSVADDPPNCPHLNASINMDITHSCRLQTSIVNEEVGETVSTALTYLPGCNAIWSGNTSKPACPDGRVEGGDLDLVSGSVYYREEPYIS